MMETSLKLDNNKIFFPLISIIINKKQFSEDHFEFLYDNQVFLTL